MLFKFVAALALIGLAAGRAYGPTSNNERMRMVLAQECRKFGGGDDALKKVEEAADKFSECFLSEIDSYTLLQIANITDDNPQLAVTVARKMCTKKTPLQNCFFNLMDGVVPCVDPVLRDRLNDSKIAVAEFGDYLCFNNAEIIGRMVGDDGKCILSNYQEITQCTNIMESVDLSTITVPSRCQKFQEGKNCMLDVLNNCSNKSYAEFLKKLFDTLVVGSYCEKGAFADVNIV